jgi:outer membrane lipoprotein-sorting protein
MSEGVREPEREGGRREPRVAGPSSEPGRRGLASQMRWAIVSAYVLALVALVLGALVLVLNIADGGGEGGAPAVAQPTATVAQPTATVQATPTTSAITNELQALGEQWEQTVSKVVYNVTSTSDGTTDESSLTLYRRPPDWRMDVSSSEGDVTMIATGTVLYWCGAESGANQCFSYDPSEYDASTTLEVFDPTVTGLNLSGQNVDRSEQTMFGESATCFSVTSTTEEITTESEWCFASDGILLQYVGTSDDPASGNFTIEATNVNRNVTEADFDFEPLYAVTPYVLSASPTPSESPASPTPSEAPGSPTPSEAPGSPTPSAAPASPTPVQ